MVHLDILEYSPIDYIPIFLNYIELAKNKFSDFKGNKEIEITFFNIPFSTLGHIYCYLKENVPSKKETYYSLEMKTPERKYRQLIDMKKIKQYNLSNVNIKSFINYSKWERKEIKEKENLIIDKKLIGDVKLSLEDKIINLPIDLLKEVEVNFVRSISLFIKMFKLNFKEIGKLRNLNNESALTLNYLTNPDDAKFPKQFRVEIEYIGNFNESPDDLNKYLHLVIQILIGSKNSKNVYFLDKKIKFPLKTFFDSPSKAILAYPLSRILITPKIDGSSVYFETFPNRIAHIYVGLKKYILKSNVNIKYEGCGETVSINGVRYIYPFYIKHKKSRLDALEEFFNSIEDNVNDTECIFREKLILKNFNSYKEVLIAMSNLLDKVYTYQIDGIILFDSLNNNSNEIVDYKIKDDNTIDLKSVIEVSKGVLIDKNKIEICLYAKKERSYEKIDTCYFVTNDKQFFDIDLHMIIKYDEQEKIYQIVPNKFISEYSLITKDIKKIRVDKTDILYLDDSKFYSGNQIDVINKSRMLHDTNNILNKAMLDSIKNNPDEYPDNEKILEYIFSSEKKQNNEDGGLYYKQDQLSIRGPLNLFTNFAKTSLITNGINSLTNQKAYFEGLDIDMGKGGDFHKYVINNVKYILGTDADLSTLEIAKDNYNKRIRTKKFTVFKLDTLNIQIIDPIFKEKIKSIHPSENKKGIKPFDFINYQLAIHFYWEPDYIPKIMNHIKACSKFGTKILITTNNGETISELLKNKSELKFLVDSENKTYFYIIKVDENKIRTIYAPSTSEEGVVENLVNHRQLIQIFQSNGFKLFDTFSHDILLDNYEMFSLLAQRHTRTSPKMFFNQLFVAQEKELKNPEFKQLLKLFRSYEFIYK
jgi:hypothetical protein